jgi:hypothetical protein
MRSADLDDVAALRDPSIVLKVASTLDTPRPTCTDSSAANQSRRPAQDAAHTFDPAGLPGYTDALYRAAYAFCGSRHDLHAGAQTAQVRPPRLRAGLPAARAAEPCYNRHRASKRRPATVTLVEDTAGAAPESSFNANEILQAVASALAVHRDVVIAVDFLGMS